MELIDGKATATAIKAEIADEVSKIVAAGGKRPHLAAVLVGHDGGSETYVKNKVISCEQCGFTSTLIRYEDDVTEEELRKNPVYRQQFKLTDREVDVAVLLLAGYNSTDIAKILTLSVNTVKTHLKNLYAKMSVHNRRELIEVLNAIEGGG